MFILYGEVSVFLPLCSSLKEKRKIIQSVTARVRKRFNISIAEVAHHELWQRSKLGFSAVTGNNSDLEIFIESIKQTLDLHINELEILEFKYEIIKV